MSKEIIPATRYQAQKLVQFTRVNRDIVTEEELLTASHNTPIRVSYENQDKEDIQLLITPQFLFGTWLCLRTLIGDLEEQGLFFVADEVVENQRK